MNYCSFQHRWDINIDELDDEEFENLLEHSEVCEFHANFLDEYNNSGMQFLMQAVPKHLELSGKDFSIPSWLGGYSPNLFISNLKLRESFVDFFKPYKELGGLILVLCCFGFSLSIVKLDFKNLIKLYEIVLAMTAIVGFLLILKKSAILFYKRDKEKLSNQHISFDIYSGTYIGKVPERHQPASITDIEKKISLAIKRIFKDGFNKQNCYEGLKLLKENQSELSQSWIHQLNKARFLRGIEQRETAENLVDDVLRNFGKNRQARGTALEVKSWFKELEFNECKNEDDSLIEERMGFIREGLKFYPNYFQLWINALEVALLKKDKVSILLSWERLNEIDSNLASNYLHTNQIKGEKNKLILELIGG